MKRFILILLLLLIVGPFVFVGAALETRVLVERDVAVSADDAQRARALFREFRALTEVVDGDREFQASESDLQSAMRFATRAVPTARGYAEISPGTVSLATSIGLPADLWLNIAADIGESEQGLFISWFRFGRFEIPSHLVVPFTRTVLNIVLGDDLGTIALSAVQNVRISQSSVQATVVMNKEDRRALATSAKNKVRRASGMVTAEHVRSYWLAIHDAINSKHLPASGSALDYPIYVIRLAIDRAESGNGFAKEVEAALLAFAIHCGHRKFEPVIGVVLPADKRDQISPCRGTKLASRGDLRRHFALSAGLHAASNADAAFAIGEYKELLDAGEDGSGFSFDDIAADMAGIKFAEFFLSSDPISAENALLRIRGEESFFPSIADLPSFMSEQEFTERFGAVDSDAYKSMLVQIENRIDRLAIFTGQ